MNLWWQRDIAVKFFNLIITQYNLLDFGVPENSRWEFA
jgi:hypothetical protein